MMDRLSRVFALGICVAGLSVAPAALGQTYPTKPVRVVVPYPPGGVGDTTMRAIAQQLSESLGQPFVIDNKPGASQMIGADAVAKAAPDGYTLFLGSVTSLAINVSSQKKMPYDPVKDFAPVSMLYFSPMYLVVNPAVPAQSVKELVALAKAQPGKLSFASIGQGGSIHLAGEMFKSMAGVDILHIPYKGAGPAYNDVISGTVTMMFANMPSMLPQVKGGKLKGLGVTSAERSKAAPEIPAIAETVPGYVATSWYGIGAPAGTPEPILAKLEAAIAEALKSPEVQKRWADDLGLDMPPPGRKGFNEFVAEDRKLWAPAVKASGVKLD